MDSPAKPAPKILILTGPTGSGKTSFVSRLPPGFEIISVDSRQIYRYVSIASAAPTPAEQSTHAYHLLEFLDPKESYSAGAFCRQASRLIGEIHARGRTPLLVGGTGFYIKSLLEGQPNHPEIPAEIVARAEARAARDLADLADFVFDRDPPLRRTIHPRDRYRLTRAAAQLLAGHIPSQVRLAPRRQWLAREKFDLRILGLDWPREELYHRINQRAEKMLATGLIAEYSFLRERGYELSDPGLQSLGYDLADRHLRGEISRREVGEALARAHRRYAKKQTTWFRTQMRPEPVPPELWATTQKEIEKWVNK